MKYDFTSIMDRKGKDALAVDGLGHGWAPDLPKEGFDAIPMWIADMNFPTAPAVTEAIIRRVNHPAFGYFETREEYYNSIIRWQQSRNGVYGLESVHIGYENGVLGGVLSALATFCSRGDNVLVLSPLYMGFRVSLENNGFHIVESYLCKDENNIWRINYADVENKILQNNIHAAIFCSPHNPTGRVWERWEIERLMALYQKYDVYVVSDEIWSDILLDGHKHIPTQSISEDAKQRTVSLYAPSKTFNLAGLIGAYRIVYNDRLRDRIEKEASLTHYNTMNVLSMHALIGAYTEEGHEWVDELCYVLSGNINFAYNFVKEHFTGVNVSKPQGTYMMFIDCSEWLDMHGKTLDELVKMGTDVGVLWQEGRAHGGATHIRINLALPESRVREAFDRLNRYVFSS